MRHSDFCRAKQLALSEPRELFGYQISLHAFYRLMERAPDLDDLRMALEKPDVVRVGPDGTRCQRYRGVEVAIASDTEVIKTVMIVGSGQSAAV